MLNLTSHEGGENLNHARGSQRWWTSLYQTNPLQTAMKTPEGGKKTLKERKEMI